MILSAALRSAAARLHAAGVPSPDADAVALAAHLLGVPPGEVRRLAALDAVAPAGLDQLVEQRARRVPLQHLTGVAHFRRLSLAVGPGVFVPRPETELLAGLGIAAARSVRPRPAVVVDLCSGSGAVAFAVKDEVGSAQVYAVELTSGAHGWAERNRGLLGLEVTLLQADATRPVPQLAPVRGGVDVVLANPPYIPPGAVPVDPEVRDHDPEPALYGGGGDGLRIPLEVAAQAMALLRPGGFFAMEHADVQGPAVVAALRRTGWADVEDHPDLAGRPRCVTARRR